MFSRLGAALIAALILIGGLIALGAPPSPASAAPVCPPVTLDDLFPPPAPSTTTTPTPTTSTPSSPTSSTTLPDATSTTTLPASTSTTATAPPSSDSTTTTPVGATPPPTSAPDRPANCEPFRYDMVWPLAGAGQIISGFGAGRDHGSRHHQGIDISAPKLTPVVAVADGVVMSVTQVVGTEDCCWMSLRHDDGWQSYYVHLNNDRYGTDDGLGVGVRSDLVEGMEVAAGEVIGWLGDSGNAEETVDHIHFELRTSDGTAIDAEPSLRAAQRAAEVVDARTAWPYADDDGLDIEWLAASLLSEGLFLPCDDEMITFCPDRVASPGFAGEIVSHLTGKTPPTINGRYQTLPASLSPNRNLARTLEQAFGCAPIDECLEHGIPETELARIAAWVRVDAMVARLLPKRSVREGGHPDVNLPSAGDAETMLRSEGTLGECNPPLDPDQLLTREETLTLLVSWVRGANPEPCSRGVQGVR